MSFFPVAVGSGDTYNKELIPIPSATASHISPYWSRRLCFNPKGTIAFFIKKKRSNLCLRQQGRCYRAEDEDDLWSLLPNNCRLHNE